ncbi:hypothetical protein LX97_03331 [Nonlabens dokdonensis]|jgi:hypothetical protein|uniref:Uncharacterized protein n=2 Tax=Nonlabens dokdonensis TaxID=328515 RepID=L7W9Q8_NONDD|nr:hypothetical protein [Nonlabens dokdonensis]AGC76962.1 hypothetical protein DDD_1835 [Nonlabens dokdonensis DSW-6]PZX36866.1 hypothetical protein LX97_03331 [Nonlabens dokdonensis]
MKEIILFLKNSWTLRVVLIVMAIYFAIQIIVGESVSLSEIPIMFLVGIYVVWGFVKRPIKK